MQVLKMRDYLAIAGLMAREIPMEILSFFVVPFALFFCKFEDQRLPKWARWFDENNYGINGELYDDKGVLIRRDDNWLSLFSYPKNHSYYARLRWLLRNRYATFSAEVTGLNIADIDLNTLSAKGFNADTSGGGARGDYFFYINGKTHAGRYFFAYYREIPWCKWFYLRIYLGWKLADIADIAFAPKERRAELMDAYLSRCDNKKIANSVWHFNPFRVRG